MPPATPAGPLAECYPFVLGAVWGPMARADVRIGGEAAPALPIQLIDEASAPTLAVPTDCSAAANGGVLDSPASLQANGVLGIGMVSYDCGLNCASGNYGSGHVLYYSCPNGSAAACPPRCRAICRCRIRWRRSCRTPMESSWTTTAR